MQDIPRFVSVVAVTLGVFDIIRAIAHTVVVGPVATQVAGLDLTGPTGLDQIILMSAFGASNVITGASLILVGLTSRLNAMILLAVIPAAYLVASIGVRVWGADLVGQGIFPGKTNMAIYNVICLVTLSLAMGLHWRGRRLAARLSPPTEPGAG